MFVSFRLEKAIDKNDVKQVRVIIQDDQFPNDELVLGLLSACAKGRADCAAAVLEAGVSPNTQGEDGTYPLTIACERVTQLLLNFCYYGIVTLPFSVALSNPPLSTLRQRTVF